MHILLFMFVSCVSCFFVSVVCFVYFDLMICLLGVSFCCQFFSFYCDLFFFYYCELFLQSPVPHCNWSFLCCFQRICFTKQTSKEQFPHIFEQCFVLPAFPRTVQAKVFAGENICIGSLSFRIVKILTKEFVYFQIAQFINIKVILLFLNENKNIVCYVSIV